jgi:hypothetical protein
MAEGASGDAIFRALIVVMIFGPLVGVVVAVIAERVRRRRER